MLLANLITILITLMKFSSETVLEFCFVTAVYVTKHLIPLKFALVYSTLISISSFHFFL